jgi:2-hydroxy-3-oxopropionate reductase
MNTPLVIPPADLQTPVGVIGLGVMGAGIARSLRRAGFAVTAYNRGAARAEALRPSGATIGTLADVGRHCRVVLLSVSDTAAVEEVLFGADGLAGTLAPGACVIDTSTIAADGARRFATRLAEKGIAFLDAPVSGGQQGAEDGKLSCMVGGDAQAFAACQAVFAAISAKALHMGPAGNGQVTKACNQIAVTACLLGVSESMALAKRQGVDPAKMREVLLGGAAASYSMDKHGERVLAGNHKPGFRAVLMRKDLRLALDNGRDGGNYMPVAALAAQLLDVLVNRGEGDLDVTALGKLFAELSGTSHTVAA